MGVPVYLSKLRPKGHTNEKGLVSSGPVSFCKIYSALNEVLLRGGSPVKSGCYNMVRMVTFTRAANP